VYLILLVNRDSLILRLILPKVDFMKCLQFNYHRYINLI